MTTNVYIAIRMAQETKNYTPTELELETANLTGELGLNFPIVSDIRRFSQPCVVRLQGTDNFLELRLSYFRKAPIHFGRLDKVFAAVAQTRSFPDREFLRHRPYDILRDSNLQERIMQNDPDVLDPLALIRYPETVSITIIPVVGRSDPGKLVVGELDIEYRTTDIYKIDGTPEDTQSLCDSLALEGNVNPFPSFNLSKMVVGRGRLHYDFPTSTPHTEVLALVKSYLVSNYQIPALS